MNKDAQKRQVVLKNKAEKFALELSQSSNSQPDYVTYLSGVSYNLMIEKPHRL